MKVFDFNVHPSASIAEEMAAPAELFEKRVAEALKHAQGCNVMLFNPALAGSASKVAPKGSCATLLADFRAPDALEQVRSARNSGFSGIKFHSYVQRITPKDFPKAVLAAQEAEKEGLWVCIDTSFGTSLMRECDNLALAEKVCARVKKTPVILLHSGGSRAIEAMLIALDNPNVYLETSFTLPFYLGSTVEQDLAFSYRKIGPGRVLYGSDHPCVDAGESLAITRRFFERHGFSKDAMADVFGGNALRLLEGQK